MSSSPEAGRSGIQVIRRAAAVLAAVGARNGALRLAELDDVVGLAKTTTHRIVNALAEERMLRIDADGRIWLGSALSALAGAAATGLVDELRPTIKELQQEVDETVDLSVLEGNAARFVDQVQSTQPLRAVSAVGTAFPLHCTANGKAFLAAMPDEAAERLLPSRLEGLTPATITSKERLLAELVTVREEGLAFDREEHTTGIAAIGAVVTRDGVPVAAISMPVPAERFAERETHLAERLRAACEAAST
ncbi:IclR family transcriptional regulator [Streptomyces sp. NPDC047108]|uniref:IclR family transcriptional regulator n=1 Tax=Streptomyces sp. NPDC047108 TaxID=3155025 RepID=UPI0033E3B344